MSIRDDIERAIAKIEGNSRVERLRRNSLMVLRQKFLSPKPPKEKE